MPLDIPAVRERLKTFNFTALFTQELGWDFPASPKTPLQVTVKEQPFVLRPIAQKRGVQVYIHQSTELDVPIDHSTRRAIHKEVRKSAHEHLIIFVNADHSTQTWQWVAYRAGQPPAYREQSYTPRRQSGDALLQKLATISVPISEEEAIDLTGAVQKLRDAFDRDKVTKRFYDRFKTEHKAFLQFITGIATQEDRQWYTSLMLNRLMFVYFIQKKGFLDGDEHYLRNRMQTVRKMQGENRFLSFYRYFLTRLFHDGLGKQENDRTLEPELEALIGKVPYLNGGFFEVHQLEERNPTIDIPDEAFTHLFEFFDEFSWHLDDRPLRQGNEINPDVVGYIFEKYINNKEMGAYYTKEDITEYISKNTIIPFLFDAARKECAAPFKPGGSIWKLLAETPDRYIYSAVRHGVIDEQGAVLPLPEEFAEGIEQTDKRATWNQPATASFGLPTETWLEHAARRKRCLELRQKIKAGHITDIHELTTLNLDIWQFARDVIVTSESPDLLRAFWHSIRKITVLDPTCGSGAFLFAALNILETLYSDCLEAMGRFAHTAPLTAHSAPDATVGFAVAESTDTLKRRGNTKKIERFSDFISVLSQIPAHGGQKYFILKSIIINNLYGVDLMEEAVEICKLRLFLKLVAQVEDVEHIEPLPDIDFNIRNGNTLIGYVSINEVRSASASESAGRSKQKLLVDDDADAEIRRIEEDALVVERAFQQFRAQQTTHGGVVTADNKAELRGRLATLAARLDRYLATEYGVNYVRNDSPALRKWKSSHKPFHWFVEFYGIIASGGFDIAIGNPPYLNANKVRTQYTVTRFKSAACPDIYAWCLERTSQLLGSAGRTGMIVPLSLGFSDDFSRIRELLFATYSENWFSSFGRIPSALFNHDVRVRNTIHIGARLAQKNSSHTTILHRWFESARPNLFEVLQYADFIPAVWNSRIPKLNTNRLSKALEACIQSGTPRVLDLLTRKQGVGGTLYFKKTAYNWLAFSRSPPPCRDSSGHEIEPSQLDAIHTVDSSFADTLFLLLNGKLAFVFWCILGDDFHVTKWIIGEIPLNGILIHPLPQNELKAYCNLLEIAMSDALQFKRNAGLLVGTYNLAMCRGITDQSDQLLLTSSAVLEAWDDVELYYSQVVRTDFPDEGPEV